MRIFNILIMSQGTFRLKQREREKAGHQIALAQLKDADKIIYGDCQILKNKVIKGKICIFGDRSIITQCTFKGAGKLNFF